MIIIKHKIKFINIIFTQHHPEIESREIAWRVRLSFKGLRHDFSSFIYQFLCMKLLISAL